MSEPFPDLHGCPCPGACQAEALGILREHDLMRRFCDQLVSEDLSVGEIIAEAQAVLASVPRRDV